MRKLTTLLALMVCSFAGFAQFAENWNFRYQATTSVNYSSEGRKVINDAAGNIYVLGDFSSDQDTTNHFISNTQYTVRLQKFDFYGNLIRTRYFIVGGLVAVGNENRSGFGMFLDGSGNVCFGYSLLNVAGNYDVVLKKVTNTLNDIWTYTYTTPGNDIGVDLQPGNNNGILAIVKTTNGSNTTYSIVSTDNNGGTATQALYNFTANTEVVNSVVYYNRIFYVTGYTLTSGVKSVMTAAIGNTGTLKWKANYNNGTAASGDDYGTQIIVGSTDALLYVLGTTYVNGTNGTDGILLRYNTSGVIQGSLSLNQSTTDVGAVIANGPSGYVFAACSNSNSVKVYKIQVSPLNAALATNYFPIPSSAYTGITGVTVADMKVSSGGNAYVIGAVTGTSASGNFSAGYLAKFGMNGFLFKLINNRSVEGSFQTSYNPVSLVLDAVRTDVIVLENYFNTYTSHATEKYWLRDYEGGGALRNGISDDNTNMNVENKLMLFPNPAFDVLNITNDASIAKVELFDILGNLVRSQLGGSFYQMQLNVSDLNRGVYMCRVTSADNAVSVKRVVVK
jgi:hypothetical protein